MLVRHFHSQGFLCFTGNFHHLCRIRWEDAHTAGPPSAARRCGPPLSGPGSGSHWPPFSPAGAGLGRRLSRCEPGAPSLPLPGPRRPLPLGCALGAGPQRAQLPSPLLHASWAQRRRWQQSLRRFLRSVDGGQDLQASKGREEKSYRFFPYSPEMTLNLDLVRRGMRSREKRCMANLELAFEASAWK